VEFRYVAEPVLQAGEVAAIVRVAMPVLAIARHRELVRDSLLWAAAGAVAAAVMLALLLSWIWYAPLREITRTARTLADGDLSRRADISGSDELAQLGAALNEMGRSLASKIHQIATQRENLVAVVENLREGVIGTDRQGRIVLMNSPALELLADGADDVVGRHLQTVIRIPEIVDVLNEVVAGGRPVDRQMELTIRHRRCTFSVHADRLSPDPPTRSPSCSSSGTSPTSSAPQPSRPSSSPTPPTNSAPRWRRSGPPSTRWPPSSPQRPTSCAVSPTSSIATPPDSRR
jgi:PAS domain-containing protein